MASVQKRGNRWVAEVRLKGKYRSKSFLMRAEAKEWAYEEEIRLGRNTGTVDGKTLGDAMRRYALEVTPKKKGARWEAIRLKKLERDPIARRPLSKLNASDFEDWQGRQFELKPSSINRELNLLSAVLTSSRKWKWLEGNPLAGYERPKDPPHRDRIITPAELARIVDALGYEGEVITQRHRIAVAALLADETAMRQGEIWGIHEEHINWEERYVLLPETKNGDSRKVPLSNRAIKLLRSLCTGRGRLLAFPQASAGVIFLRAIELAEVQGATFHDLRHSATTRLAKRLSMLELAKFIGHKDPRNLMRYFNPKPADIADKLNDS